ncbi:lysophospholipid acyltransferase family protein [PVC group bacterium]|nr:lysophospholipid acyltransferase family protein [PVC group bacterium]
MAQNQSAVVNWFQYLSLRSIASIIGCFPIDLNMRTASLVGDCYFNFIKRRREGAIKNIASSFPEWTSDQVKKTARDSIRHMFQLFIAESVHMPSLITPSSLHKYVQFRDVEKITDRLVRNKPVIFITGHCGNWELLGYSLSVLGHPIAAVARPLDNPLINDWVLDIRQKYGLQIITTWGGVPVLQDIISSGGSIGFIADQNAGGRGMFVPFFGRLASTYKSIGLLAMRYNVPIAAVHAKRIGSRFKYEVSITDYIEPSDWCDRLDPLYYITARYNKAIETMVRNAPEQYLWLHRRWKSRPVFEREGKPMPKRLITQIESLPWLGDQELEALIRC